MSTLKNGLSVFCCFFFFYLPLFGVMFVFLEWCLVFVLEAEKQSSSGILLLQIINSQGVRLYVSDYNLEILMISIRTISWKINKRELLLALKRKWAVIFFFSVMPNHWSGCSISLFGLLDLELNYTDLVFHVDSD